jgi:hypothetical protein
LFVEIELNLRQPGGKFHIPLVFYFHVAHFSPLLFALSMLVNSVASLEPVQLRVSVSVSSFHFPFPVV